MIHDPRPYHHIRLINMRDDVGEIFILCLWLLLPHHLSQRYFIPFPHFHNIFDGLRICFLVRIHEHVDFYLLCHHLHPSHKRSRPGMIVTRVVPPGRRVYSRNGHISWVLEVDQKPLLLVLLIYKLTRVTRMVVVMHLSVLMEFIFHSLYLFP